MSHKPQHQSHPVSVRLDQADTCIYRQRLRTCQPINWSPGKGIQENPGVKRGVVCDSADLCVQRKSRGGAGVRLVPGPCGRAPLLAPGLKRALSPGALLLLFPCAVHSAGHGENLASCLTGCHTREEFAGLSVLRGKGSPHLSPGTYKLGLSGGSPQCRFDGTEAWPGLWQSPPRGEREQGSPSPGRKPLLKQLQQPPWALAWGASPPPRVSPVPPEPSAWWP